ncbi:MAG TPA: hypothetical protein VJZ06_10640 [Mobilitalea sp.]|nr:hypothetical protein [Mobilitalea sp.]
MSDIIINTNSKETTATQVQKKEAIMQAAGDTVTIEETASETITETAPDAVETTEEDVSIEETNTAITEDAVVEDEMISDESSDSIEEGVDTGMGFEEGVDMGMGFDEGMYSDPMMETGMAEVKDPLLSSWPFVIGISAAVLCVSIILGILLARRKIKKGIELYED